MAKSIAPRQPQLFTLYTAIMGTGAGSISNHAVAVPGAVSQDDVELLQLGRQRFPVLGRLLDGDSSAYGHDESDADWGLSKDLLTLTGHDPDRAERLALTS